MPHGLKKKEKKVVLFHQLFGDSLEIVIGLFS